MPTRWVEAVSNQSLNAYLAHVAQVIGSLTVTDLQR
jgi:hypothetical protein